MATHEPPESLFNAQVESIRRQTHRRFVCIVSDDASSDTAWDRVQRTLGDDPRFAVSRSSKRLGFYANFERCLSLVPAEAAYVALADQDDVWHEDKLSVLVDALDASGAELAYSDMAIVDEQGAVIRGSYWHDRRNAFDQLGSLLLMNTVSGAASLFRRGVLDDALPFPAYAGKSYHDHWLACVALASGSIKYVERPLYDYVQHESNAAGAFNPSPQFRGGLARAFGRFAADPRARLRSTVAHAPSYSEEVMRVELFARTLQERLAGRLDGSQLAILRRASRLESLGSVLWLLGRSARDLSGRSPTLGAELQLLKGIAWRRSHVVWRRVARPG